MAGYSNKGVSADKIALWILMLLALGFFIPVAWVIERGIMSSLY